MQQFKVLLLYLDSLKARKWQKYFFRIRFSFFGEKGTLIFEFSAKFLNENMERSSNYSYFVELNKMELKSPVDSLEILQHTLWLHLILPSLLLYNI